MNTFIILSGSGGFIFNVLQLMELARVPKEQRPDFKMLYLKILNPTISETNLFIELELQEGEVKDC